MGSGKTRGDQAIQADFFGCFFRVCFRFHLAFSLRMADRGTEMTARKSLFIRSAWSGASQRAASSGGICIGFGWDFILIFFRQTFSQSSGAIPSRTAWREQSEIAIGECFALGVLSLHSLL
jgi:hypothetical protein